MFINYNVQRFMRPLTRVILTLNCLRSSHKLWKLIFCVSHFYDVLIYSLPPILILLFHAQFQLTFHLLLTKLYLIGKM